MLCCMGGMKAVRGVALCGAPCCPGEIKKVFTHTSVSQKATNSKYPGYHEEVEAPPLLAPVVSCRKDGGGRARRRGGELAFYGR